MFGIILFWFQYIVAFLMIHTIIFGTYEKTPEDNKCYYHKYVQTDNDKRHKYPLWLILIGIIIWFVPVLNIFLYSMFMAMYPDEDKNHLYFKSFLTKKY